MIHGKLHPSPSSQGVTFLRALSQYERHPVLRNPDYLAAKFLSPAHSLILKLARPWWARPILAKIHPGAYFFQISRIRFGDEALVKALNEGIEQVVILGAGNDTRAIRFQDLLVEKKVRVLELDIPATQAWKTQKIIDTWGALPQHVSYVPIDFNLTSLEDALMGQYSVPYDKSLKTLFFWEGVSYYLNAEAVDSVLDFIVTNSHSESLLVFDYLHLAVLEGRATPYGARETLEKTRERGEPFTFGIEQDQIGAYLKKHGLDLLVYMTPDEATTQYLADEKGMVLGRQHAYLSMVKARTLPQDVEAPSWDLPQEKQEEPKQIQSIQLEP